MLVFVGLSSSRVKGGSTYRGPPRSQSKALWPYISSAILDQLLGPCTLGAPESVKGGVQSLHALVNDNTTRDDARTRRAKGMPGFKGPRAKEGSTVDG